VADGDEAGGTVTADGYPAGLESVERLRDGMTVRFRPIRPSDGDALVAFHDGLSPQSVYRRFFFVHPHLSVPEVERFTRVDYVDRMAFAVLDGERIVGVGRYERLPGTTEAEVAFVVTDDHQHLGIGTLLLDHLADAARTQGIDRFTAQTLSDNRDMLGLFLASGFPVATSSDAGTVTLRFPIAVTADYRTARASRRFPDDPEGPSDPSDPSGDDGGGSDDGRSPGT
jgi:GNAT superfamily N-acetyltransferase